MEYAGWNREDETALERRNGDPRRPLEDVLEQARRDGNILGLRHFDGHDHSIQEEMLQHRDVIKIILTRNMVASFVSLQMARATGEWIRRSHDDSSPTQIRFDVDRYQTYANRLQRYYAGIRDRLETTGQTYLFASYEDVLNNDKIVEIARFVGSRSAMISEKTILRKQSSGTLRDKLINYDEVSEFLARCTTEPWS